LYFHKIEKKTTLLIKEDHQMLVVDIEAVINKVYLYMLVQNKKKSLDILCITRHQNLHNKKIKSTIINLKGMNKGQSCIKRPTL